MFCVFVIFTLSILIYNTAPGASIQWHIKGEYVIYGKDVTLTCNGNSCPPEAKKKWYGGPNYKLLGFDGYSTNPTKYTMAFHRNGQEFDLIIRGFNVSDANCDYACACGFLQFKNKLKLNDSNFIYLPVVEADSSKLDVDTFQIDLVMIVFPLPKCELFYEDNAFPVNLIDIKGPTGSGFQFYLVRIQRTKDLRSYKCKGNLTLICQVRSFEHQLLHLDIDFCKFENESSANKILMVVFFSITGSFISSVVFTTIALGTYKFVKAKLSNSDQGHITENDIVLPFNSHSEENGRLMSSLNDVEGTQMLDIPSNELGENANMENEHF